MEWEEAMDGIERAVDVLDDPRGVAWEKQGFGMFRCYLDEERISRLHIWTKDVRVPSVTTIHTHPWDFQSRVLCGRIRNIRYEEVETNPDGLWTRRLIVPGPDACKVGDEHRVVLRLRKVDIAQRGEAYEQSYDEIHETFFEEGTVTVCTRRVVDEDLAYSYRPYYEEWVSAAPVKVSFGEVAPYVFAARDRVGLGGKVKCA